MKMQGLIKMNNTQEQLNRAIAAIKSRQFETAREVLKVLIYRETGILRRLSVTPGPPSWLLSAQIVINLAIAVIGIFLTTAVGVAAFALQLPRDIPWFLLALFLTMTSLFCIGLFIAAVVRNDALAQGIGGILFFS
jgi:ABC-2 type transport system permease protein